MVPSLGVIVDHPFFCLGGKAKAACGWGLNDASPVAAAAGCDRPRRGRRILRPPKAFGLIADCGSGYRCPWFQ
ncbi:hypothetical protein EMIT0196P_50230 [Pseudomonas chlororaphis]